MSEESNTEVFVYTEGVVVPHDVVRVRVHPSVTIIPENAFKKREKLEVVELCEGLLEIGSYAFSKCKTLKKITIPSTVTLICSHAFAECRQLEELELFDGLQEIEEYAFLYIGPLKRLIIPNTVRSIGDLAFCHVRKLQYLQLPEGIESIGVYAFSHNRCPTCRIPPSLTTITSQFIGTCRSMFSLEFSQDVTDINRFALERCHSLRNLAFPPNAQVEDKVFSESTNLEQLYETKEQLINALKHRFDDLPIHKMIYYQSYNNVSVDQLNEATSIRISQRRSKLDPTGKQQDCMGMTPLHILACSTLQDVQLYKVLVDKHPENLITEDRWGAIPLLYASWGNAPNEVVRYLIESYQSLYPNYELDWTKLIEQLFLGNVAASSIQRLLNVQERSFSGQSIDWHTIIQKTATSATPVVQADVFSFLVKCTFSKRVDTVGIKQWRDDLTLEIEEQMLYEKGPIDEPKNYVISSDIPKRQRWLGSFNSKLAEYEARYRELKEATTILELVLWKNKFSEASNSKQVVESGKKMKFDESAIREQCRSRCGADIVVENVLPYLISAPTNDSSTDMESDDDNSSDMDSDDDGSESE